MMQVIKNDKIVGNIGNDAALFSDNIELRSIYNLLQKEGMEVLESGGNNIDVEKHIPLGPKTIGLLAKTLEGFGYDVESDIHASSEITFRGMKIKIENPAGSVRSGTDRVTGKPWQTKMTHDYGEIIGTNGVDGDPVDVFLGPNKSAKFVYVVHQLNKNTGEWDEDKCFLGFDDALDAKAAYYKNYDNPDVFYGSIETIPLSVFKERVFSNNGDTMIHASKGEPVTVDGMRGRGVIVDEKGDDVIIRFRNGIHIKRNKMFVHSMNTNNYKNKYMSAGGPGSGRKPSSAKGLNYWKSPEKERELARKDPNQKSLFKFKLPKNKSVKSAEEMVERENGPITTPQGTNKRIQKVGSLFCVISDGTDKNFGCYNSQEQAEAVMKGQSFIQPNLPDDLKAGGPGSGRHPEGGVIKRIIEKLSKPKKEEKPSKLSWVRVPGKNIEVLVRGNAVKAFGDLGEPMAGALSHGHMEPNPWFHPPSLKNADQIPTDDPREKNDRFLDVTKRKQAHKDRMKRLKRSAPGGLPPQIPVKTTAVEMHQQGFTPSITSSRMKLKKSKGLIDIIPPKTTLLVNHTVAYSKPARDVEDKRMRRKLNSAHI